MSHEEQILATLNKLLEAQHETIALHRQTIENQQRAIASAQASISNQMSTSRIYRISLAVAALALGYFLYKVSGSR